MFCDVERGMHSFVVHGRSRMTIRRSHPYNAGTEDVGFSPTRQILLAPSAKRREVFDESHEGWAASLLRIARETDFLACGGQRRMD